MTLLPYILSSVASALVAVHWDLGHLSSFVLACAFAYFVWLVARAWEREWQTARAWLLYIVGDIASRVPWNSRAAAWVYTHTMPIAAEIGLKDNIGPFREGGFEGMERKDSGE